MNRRGPPQTHTRIYKADKILLKRFMNQKKIMSEARALHIIISLARRKR